jgi:WD40 repeat protein
MFLKSGRAILLTAIFFLWFFAFKILWFKPSHLPKHSFSEITHILTKSQNSQATDLRPHAYSPDGRTLAIGTADGKVTIKSLETYGEEMSLAGTQEAVEQIWYSPDGKTLAVVHRFGDFFLWDVEKGTKLLSREGDVRWFAFTRDSKLALLQDEWKRVLVWDVQANKRRAILQNPQHMHSLALFPDSLVLGSVSEEVKRHSTGKIITSRQIDLWDLASGKKCRVFPVDSGKVYSIGGIAPDGRKVVLEGPDGKRTLIWDLVDGKASPGPIVDAPFIVRFSRDGKTLITVGDYWKTWDTTTWQETNTVAIKRGWSAFLSDDGRALAVQKPVRRSEGFVGWFLSLLGGRRSSYEMVQLWDIKSGTVIAEFPDATLPLISPDGKTVATINRGGLVQIWDIPPRRNSFRLVGLWTLGLAPVLCVAFYLRRRKRSKPIQ